MISFRRVFCDECFEKRKLSNKTIEEVSIRKYSNRYDIIRAHAYKESSKLPQICSKCGYSKHVEVCHIKSISSFPKDTLLSVVNSLDNLIMLCPNCHWEFDNLSEANI